MMRMSRFRSILQPGRASKAGAQNKDHTLATSANIVQFHPLAGSNLRGWDQVPTENFTLATTDGMGHKEQSNIVT
jgi:hypothetical protein